MERFTLSRPHIDLITAIGATIIEHVRRGGISPNDVSVCMAVASGGYILTCPESDRTNVGTAFLTNFLQAARLDDFEIVGVDNDEQ